MVNLRLLATRQVKWRLDPEAYQGLLDRLHDTLKYEIETVAKVPLSEVTNYDEVYEEIARPLRDLRDRPNRLEEPLIYHLDVSAMCSPKTVLATLAAVSRVSSHLRL